MKENEFGFDSNNMTIPVFN